MTRALIYYCICGLLFVGLTAGCKSDVKMDTADTDGGLGTSQSGSGVYVPDREQDGGTTTDEEDQPGDGESGDEMTTDIGIRGGGTIGTDGPSSGESDSGGGDAPPPPPARDNSREQIQSAFRLADSRVAYIGERTSFAGVSGNFAQSWNWAWDVGGNGSPEGRDAGGFDYTFSRLGTQSLVVTAERADYEPLRWSTELLVTVSRSKLDQLISKMVSQAVAVEESQQQADEDKLAATVQELQRYMDSGVKIRVRGEGVMDYRDFSDLVYADLGIEKNFSSVANYEYDPATGKVIDLTLR